MQKGPLKILFGLVRMEIIKCHFTGVLWRKVFQLQALTRVVFENLNKHKHLLMTNLFIYSGAVLVCAMINLAMCVLSLLNH